MATSNGKLNNGNYQASLQTKFFLTFVILLLIVLGCFLIYVNWLVIKPLKERTENEKLMTAAKVSDQVDIYINNQNQLSQRILSNKEIFTSLSDEFRSTPTIEGLTRSRKLKTIMFQALGPSMNIRDMIIYDLQGKAIASFIGYDTNPPSLKPFLEDSSTAGQWSKSSYILTRQQTGIVSFIRAIMNQNGEVFGYLSIQLDQAYLQIPANGVAVGDVIILDQEGQVISSSRNAAVEETVPNLVKPTVSSGIYMDSSQNYIAYYQSANTGWTTYLVTPKKSVLGPVNSVKYISILLITSLMLFSFFYIYFSAKNLLLPIRKLRSQILRVNYSNMNVKVDSRRSHNNELIMLNVAFQELLERLQQSIEREKLALHEEVMARNSALQAQIAPHFIHNVLYLISIAAQEGKNDVVSDMCKHLSDSLRYIVSSPYQHVTMADELEHARHYLSLVQQKYEDDLEWEIEADENVGLIHLPRLVIQPFVENCIEHAFKNTAPPWRIQIRVKLFNGVWAIEISDNGNGFETDKIKEILANIDESESGAQELHTYTSGIGNMGIVNTVNRLKLMYKNRLFFNVYNEGEGATVQIIASLTKDFY
ncbi:cache domain-containing sensor histidine kinase [Cohnella luojiensis]|uniref:Sensor histidine kinase n=1 Tax=Cohnella luojiensis TaxID=652876 RepID=A0A4Y8LQX8_9BACL|nr:sensor histidine kinase [Cohnella luojiensis]TFE23211.1 sensor histidine kinase [Cohnella luojiensis]